MTTAPEQKSTRLTQRSWISLGMVVLQLAMSLADFFVSPHNTTLRTTIVGLWILMAWVFAPILVAGFRHGFSGMRDAFNRSNTLRPTAGNTGNRASLIALVVGMVAVTGYCVWLAYKT